MLETLGIDQRTELIYRTMLLHANEGVAELARRLQLSDDQIREGLKQLSQMALIQPTEREHSGFRAVSPEAAMELLLARQQAELAAQQLQVAASRAAAARLISECSALLPRPAQPDSEHIDGPDAIRDRLHALGQSVEHEVMTLAPGGAHPEEDLRASRAPNAELLDRGVRIRTVYLNSVRNHRPTLDHVTWLRSHGGQVRTAATLPVRMIIMDRQHAVLPVDMTDARVGAIVVSGAGTVAALCALFDSIWSSATPLGDAPAPDARGLPAQEAETLRLLAMGLTDEAIARRLGVSPRTARRVASELMTRLDARSRFEAGVHAVQLGWLPATQ
jgi:DNA-binding CsgD family transcriptional regulator/sugar-specific transcriptional regulator TrmB